MSGLEFNKLAAACLVSGLVAMVSGKIADFLYEPILEPSHRGFQVAMLDTPARGSPNAEPEQISFDIHELMANANASNGENIAKKCLACHTFEEGGHNKVGPNLWDIVNAQKARNGEYAYSANMKSKGGTWNYDDLFHFLHKPKDFINGTKMSFVGLKDPKDIADVISYLRSLSKNQSPLP